jgi:hypothetical protein
MSFDIFVARFRDAKPSAFKRASFEKVFGKFIAEQRTDFVRLRYPNGGAEVYVDDTDDIGSVMFNHCGGDAFWEGVYQFAKEIDGVIWWPNVDHISAIASADILQHLPAMFVDEEAHPTVIANGQELLDAIGRS